MADTGSQQTGGSWRFVVLVALVGIVAGLALAAWGLSRSPTAQRWLLGSPATKPAPVITYAPNAVRPQQVAPAPVAPGASPADLSGRMADLEARVAKVEGAADEARDSSRAEGLLIAFAARRALDRGMALGYVEGQLNQHFGASQPRAVAMIVAAARQPATIDQLKAGLDAVTPQLAGARPDQGWWDGVRQSLSGLIVVRKPGAPSPDPAERVASARDMIESGRVDAALAEIARLPNRDKAAAWIAAARRHIEAYRALDLLEAAAIMDADNSVPQQQQPVTL